MAIKKTESSSNEKPKKKEIKKNTPPRQQKAIEIIQSKMVENGGKITKGKILKEAGYPESTQNNPAKVFESASMRRAMKKVGLDLTSLRTKHKQLINAGRVDKIECSMKIPPNEFIDMILDAIPGSRFLNYWDNPMFQSRMNYFIIPDTITQAKMLELQYKVIGELTKVKDDTADTIQPPVLYLPDNKR